MDGYVKIGTKLDTKSFDAQIDYIESQLNEIDRKLKQADAGFEVGDTQKLEAQYEKLSIQLTTLKKKQADFNKADLTRAQKNIEKVGNSTSKVIKKLGKWALGVFAIESAYGFVRTSISKLSQYNEQIRTDVEYIGYSMATALQPVVERLIALAYKLLGYVNYISMAWFGVNLFANASAKAMNKASENAKKMSKIMAGFDEMNVINDNGSVGTAGVVLPSENLQAPDNVEPPSWLVWIAENKEIVSAGLGAIAGGLISIKFGLEAIKGLGVGVMLAGIIILIQSLVSWVSEMGDGLDENKVSWDTLGKTIIGIGVIVAGLAILIGSFPLAVAAACIAVIGLIAKNWEKIKSGGLKAIKWLEEKFGYIGEVIALPIRSFLDIFDGLFKGIRGVVGGIIKICKGDLAGGLKSIFKGIGNFIIGVLNAIINGFNTFIYPLRALIVAVGKVTGKGWTMSSVRIPRIPYLAKGGIVSMPNRGVPVGGAMAGESGREGVLPLTDAQAMQELGNAIGKYITINANITNTMNGRIISRELQRIKSDDDFAFNR